VVKCISTDLAEFKQIARSIDWCTKQLPDHRRTIKSAIDRPILLLQEYIQSLTCDQMLVDRATKFFTHDSNNLIALGRLVAADIAFNNSDRFPLDLIWATKGNSGNFLFSLQSVQSNDLK
jgi:hypothetical protein